MPRNLEGVFPRHESSNRNTDFGPRYNPLWSPAVVCKLMSSSFGCGPGEYSLRQSPTDKTTFVEVQVPGGEVLAHHCYNKIYKFGYIGEAKRNSLTLPTSSIPQNATVQGQERFFSAHDFSWGESRMV